jgi:hypothetical protein
MYPEVVIAGRAGAGKSTVAQLLAERYGVPIIEYADEIKRFCGKVFGFTEEQLWGPSEARNGVDPRYGGVNAPQGAWEQAEALVVGGDACQWIDAVFGKDRVQYSGLHRDWFFPLYQQGEISPRVALQTLGTWGRTIQRNVWVDLAGRVSAQLLEGGCRYHRAAGIIPEEGAPAPLFVAIVGARYPNEILGTKARGGFAVLVEDTAGSNAAGRHSNHSSETSLRLIPREWYTGVIENDKTKGLDWLAEETEELVELVAGQL